MTLKSNPPLHRLIRKYQSLKISDIINHLENIPCVPTPRNFMLTVKVMLLKQHQSPRKISIPLLQEFCKGLAKFCSLISNLSQIAEKFNSEVSYIQTMRYNNTTFLANVAYITSHIFKSGSSELQPCYFCYITNRKQKFFIFFLNK